MKSLTRSKNELKRPGLTTTERWSGSDKGLIYCWERGREKREEEPALAQRAERGELPILAWSGGVTAKLKSIEEKPAPFHYLATWQGLRNEDLNIPLEGEKRLTCTRTKQLVVFSIDWRDKLPPSQR